MPGPPWPPSRLWCGSRISRPQVRREVFLDSRQPENGGGGPREGRLREDCHGSRSDSGRTGGVEKSVRHLDGIPVIQRIIKGKLAVVVETWAYLASLISP
jgi:hypothetical protein